MFIKQRLALTGLLAAFALAALPASATPLNLDMVDAPDIASFGIGFSYDAASDIFSATGTALTVENPLGISTDILGVFSLDAEIDDTGALIGGSFSIMDLLTLDTLIEGALVDFGFAGSTFEFLFAVGGGTLAADFGDFGGILMTDLSFGLADFSAIFANGNNAVADTAALRASEPGILLLQALGLTMLLLARRRRA